jgi:hypothetical protein
LKQGAASVQFMGLSSHPASGSNKITKIQNIVISQLFEEYLFTILTFQKVTNELATVFQINAYYKRNVLTQNLFIFA